MGTNRRHIAGKEQENMRELCMAIEMPMEVTEDAVKFDREFDYAAAREGMEKLFAVQTWEEGLAELKKCLGEDPKGFKMLACMLHCCRRTWDFYKAHDISGGIFVDTMKCFSRFVKEHKESFGYYGFDRQWWTARQLCGLLFRIGELEYEMIREDGTACLSIHIPSDAVLAEEKIQESCCRARDFFAGRFPEYADADMVCHSWLLSPTLRELLAPGSRILGFQEHFAIRETGDYDDEFLQWVFKRKDIPTGDLPENTSLQRRMKEYLLRGGKVADAEGVWKR